LHVNNIRGTRDETLATAGTPGALTTAERTTSTGEVTTAQETIGTSGAPTIRTAELMETPIIEGMLTIIGQQQGRQQQQGPMQKRLFCWELTEIHENHAQYWI
jgi:hypothetical protein